MPRVSVIVPTCDRPEFLHRAVASALAQTERDLEVLVVDDNSQGDHVDQIVGSHADPRVRTIRLAERRGVAAARNAGIGQSAAPYIAFLDDDDEWLPAKLAIQLRVMDESPLNVAGVYTARYTVDASSGRKVLARFAGRRFAAGYQNVITTSSLLVRQSCFAALGVFDEHLVAASDWDMWIRIAARYEFRYIDIPLVRYTVHARRISENIAAVAQSRERILAKHSDALAAYPRLFSQRYTALGMLYYRAGDIEKARRSFRTAIRRWPLELRAYCHLLAMHLEWGPLRKIHMAVLGGGPRRGR